MTPQERIAQCQAEIAAATQLHRCGLAATVRIGNVAMPLDALLQSAFGEAAKFANLVVEVVALADAPTEQAITPSA